MDTRGIDQVLSELRSTAQAAAAKPLQSGQAGAAGGADFGQVLKSALDQVSQAQQQAQQMAQAARLLAATEVPFNRYKNRYLPADRQIREDNLTKVRLALGEESFAAAFCEGTTMTEDQAYALALELCGKEQV